MLGCIPMTGDSVECFNCGRANPSWAQVCRSCGVPMRPGGAGSQPPAGRLPTDRDSLFSIGAALATIGVAIVFGLILSGMLPEAPAGDRVRITDAFSELGAVSVPGARVRER